ncbi:MAG: MFS transporter [Deltaproteobacteria bacterium]|nr:MFS transporter [Deltaproteobacteria bacterium]
MVFPGWIIVAAGFLVLMASGGSHFAFSVFLIPLSEEFGWTRASTAGIFSLSVLIFGIGSIFSGRMVDRFGPRLVVGAGGVLMGSGLVLSAIIQSLWQLYACYGIMIGIGVSAGWGPLTATVSRWFIARRGLAMGIMSIGVSMGILIVPPLSRHLITVFGWRSSFALMGVITGAIIVGSAFLLHSDPNRMGLVPYGEKIPEPRPEGVYPSPSSKITLKDWSLPQALVTRTFWMIFAGYLLWCMGFYMVPVHLAAYCTDIGLSPMAAALAVSLIGGGSIFGKVLMGLLSDRIGPQKVLVINLLLQSVCIFGLIGSRSITSLYFFSSIFGFGYGGTGPQLPVVAAKFFGLSSIGAIFGILILSGQIGGAIGPLLAGRIFDLSQSYLGAFILGGASIMVSFFLILLLRLPTASPK